MAPFYVSLKIGGNYAMKNKKLIYIALFAVILVLIAISPIFSVQEIQIIGNNRLTNSEIIEIIEFDTGQNIFTLSPRAARNKLRQNPYIDTVEITRDFFSRTVEVNLVERVVRGYVEHGTNNFLYIDREGRVLEIRSYMTERLPVIIGLRPIGGFVLGEPLNVENTGAFNIMLTLTALFEKYEIDQDIVRVVLTDENDINFFYHRINVRLGNNQDLDMKLRTLKEILPTLEAYKLIGGRLFLENISVEPFFQPNT